VIDARKQRSESLAIARNSAGGRAAKARTVVTSLTADQPNPGPLSASLMISKGCFESR
jgi:hypothetical protein